MLKQAVLNLILVVKALLSYPLPYFATAKILEDNLMLGHGLTFLPCAYGDDRKVCPFYCIGEHMSVQLREWAVAIRVLLVLVTLLIALWLPHFALLMGVIGK